MHRLSRVCPAWKRFVSINETWPDKLASHGQALIQGMKSGMSIIGTTESVRCNHLNLSLSTIDNPWPKKHVSSVVDWAIDLGYGFGADCQATENQSKKQADWLTFSCD